MNRKGLFKCVSVLLALLLLVSLLPQVKLTASAVALNEAIAADPAAWGTQNNNGWYYMYKLTDGTYHEMNFYDSTDGVNWRQNAFASDLSTTAEMFFINQSAVFYGENNTRPVYAFEAPESGEVTLRMQTHSTEQMHMQVYVNNTLQQIGGEDSLTLSQAGTLPGSMTLTELTMNVIKGQRIYVEFYSTDMNAQRQAWINEYSVTYNSVVEGDEEDLTGHTFAADSSAWGTQNNNGWYYMYKLTDGTYHEMNFYDSTDGIDWRQNAFASDLSTTVEMFFINQSAVFYGENNTRPVYAFEAPESGEVTLRMQTHSTTQMHMQVYLNSTLQQIGGEDSLTLSQAGTLPGAMTLTELTMNVKKGQHIYVEFYSTDISGQRQAWINEYSVTYNSVVEGDEEDLTGHTFAPDSSAWGTQNNNGWYYMYKLTDGTYHEMNFYDSTDEIGWRQNAYASDLSTTAEMFFINQSGVFYGENNTRPVYAFEAPVSGEVTLRMQTHSTTQMHMQVYVNDTLQQIGGEDSLTLSQAGTLPGAMTLTELTMNVKRGQRIYVEFYSTDISGQRQAWINEYSVTYNSVIPADQEVRIVSASLKLDEDIDMIYTVSLPRGSENPYMVFDYMGSSVRVNSYTVDDQGRYCFVFERLVPQCMGQNISATAYATVNDEVLSDTVASYSVRTYCINQLSRNSDNAALVTLLSDLLTYGAAAQQYTGFDTAHLVTSGAGLSPSDTALPTNLSASFTGTADAAVDWIAATLILGNNVATRFYFTADDVSSISVDVSIGNSTETFDEFVSMGGGKYYFDFFGIEATQFDDTVSATFYVNGVEAGRTINYSVNTYVCNFSGNSTTPYLSQLLTALYRYGCSAKAYALSQEEEPAQSRFEIVPAGEGGGWLPLIP